MTYRTMAKTSRKRSSLKAAPRRKLAFKSKPIARKSKPAASCALPAKGKDFTVDCHNCDPASFKADILRHLTYTLARDTTTAIRMDWWLATCFALRDRVLERFLATQGRHAAGNVRRVHYFSLEYLMGRLLRNNLSNLGMLEAARTALTELGKDFDDITEE